MNIEIWHLVSSGIASFSVGATIGYWIGSRNPQITTKTASCGICVNAGGDWEVDIVLKNGRPKTVLCNFIKNKQCSVAKSRCHYL